MTQQADERPILFFDGVCGLCNRFIDFVLKHDRFGRVVFAPLQGETAAERLTADDVAVLDTVVFLDNDRVTRRSSAIVRVLIQLGGFWRLLGSLLWVIPRPMRDLGYRVVAKNRYRFFGKKETCRMPTPDERARFLD